METHAHHLHKAPGKKFWHYFFEFFMLFLAVFCGFWAENVREHNIEAKWEKRLMRSLLDDLRADTLQLTSRIQRNNGLIQAVDTLLSFSPYETQSDENILKLYQLTRDNAVWISLAILSDRTITQLKNAGYMRLIEDADVSNAIMEYEDRKNRLADERIDYEKSVSNINAVVIKLFDFVYLNAVLNRPVNTQPLPRFPDHVFEPAYFREFQNDLFVTNIENRLYVSYMKNVLEEARELIKVIQKAYPALG